VSKVRRLIAPVACAWLLLHVSVVAGTTVLLVATGSASDPVCTCGQDGNHGLCPMHHQPADSARCRMQSTHNGLESALLSMLGPLTLPVATATVIADATPSSAIAYQSPLRSNSTFPPDPPPPRS
jgi:hypothetical protein